MYFFSHFSFLYTISDVSKRSAHDRMLNGHVHNNRNEKSSKTHASQNYRKVYAPQPPPGFKTFDSKRHYEMHYGDGMMKEEIERARQRAEKAGGRNNSGWEYSSPLGEGFDFTNGNTGNPFSKSGRKLTESGNPVGKNSDKVMFDIEYEEGYMDMSDQMMNAKAEIKGRALVHQRLQERRQMRRRNRGDPLNGSTTDGDASCVMM